MGGGEERGEGIMRENPTPISDILHHLPVSEVCWRWRSTFNFPTKSREKLDCNYYSDNYDANDDGGTVW